MVDNTPLLSSVMLEQASLLMARGAQAAAKTITRRALPLVSEGGWPVQQVYARLRLADLLMSVPSAAEPHLLAAHQLAERFALPRLRYRLNERFGHLRRLQGRDEEARLLLEAAVEEIERLRGTVTQDAMRASFLRDKTDAYEDLLRLYLAEDGEESVRQAFAIAERETPYDFGNDRDDDGDGVKDEMVGHGTHVAGIVALAAPGARIMPVRALDSEGRGTTFGIAKAIRYSVSRGADVVNLSLGSSAESDLLEDLIGDGDDDSSSRTFFVAAAGNDGNTTIRYPAGEDGAIAVSSVDQAKKKSDFANFGSWISIAAPGSGIHSSFPTSRYATWSGTSMATPFVAGQAALIKSLKPTAPAECVTGIIRTTAEPLAASDPTYGTRLGGHADLGASTAYARSNPCLADDD